MYEIMISIKNKSYLTPVLLINNKEISLTKNKRKNVFIGHFFIEEQTAEIEIYNYQPLESKYWFLIHYLFFIISFFGIFDIQYDKTGKSLLYKSCVDLNGRNCLNFVLSSFKANETAVLFDGESIEKENRFYINETIRKRGKTLKIAKTFSWILGIIIGIICVVVIFF
ncbi:MAG: hypothetical protein K2I42_05190 [Anaeroplasmataceae bacterium]|nr:hypothetical protein [Anaeroplasmataceae bacterium]